MHCVVCERPIQEPQYANPFEKIRRLYPCCSAACAQRFDPDVHWLPANAPARLETGDQQRMLRLLEERLAQGDRPTIVVRDMLIAGCAPDRLRFLLAKASTESTQHHAAAQRKTFLGMIGGLFTGKYRFAESRDKRDPKLVDAAVASIDAWEQRYAKGPA
jgi:hypothetical protein